MNSIGDAEIASGKVVGLGSSWPVVGSRPLFTYQQSSTVASQCDTLGEMDVLSTYS